MKCTSRIRFVVVRWLATAVALALLCSLAPSPVLAAPSVPPTYVVSILDFFQPRDVAVDVSGNFYVADTGNNRIKKFNPSGALLEVWTGYAGQFKNGPPAWTKPWVSPRSVAVDEAGNVYVLHTVRSEDANVPDWEEVVKVLGEGVSSWAQWVADPDLPPTASHWWNLSVNGAGTQVDVTTCQNVAQFALSGGELALTASQTAVQPPPEGGAPAVCGNPDYDVAIDSAGSAYVATGDGGQICKLDGDLSQVTSWGTNGCVSGGGPLQPWYQSISVDADGYIYAGDGSNGVVEAFDSAGNTLGQWGSYAAPKVAVSPDGAAIYVADTLNNCVHTYLNASFIATAQNGNWGETTTWAGGIVPGPGNNVEVRHHVALTDDREVQTLKVEPGGQVDIEDQVLTVHKDLVDNSSPDAEAITSSGTNPGKLVFDGPTEQKIRTETKTDETKLGAKLELKQRLTLEKPARFQEELKLVDKDAWTKGYIDLNGKDLALEKDLVDDSSADKAIDDSDPGKPGKLILDGPTDQKIRSDNKTAQTKIEGAADLRKPSGKLIVTKATDFAKSICGASGLSGPQEVDLQAKATINVAETIQQARIRQSASSGSTITALLRNAYATATLATNNQVLVRKESLEVVVEAGDPVTGTVGNVSFSIPVSTTALIDERVDGQFTITNISINADAGTIEVTIDGQTAEVAPGETVGGARPVADPGGPYLGPTGTDILFDGSGSSDADGDTLSYAWTFGDAYTGTLATPTHSYDAVGIYDVCLTVNDGWFDSDPVCTIAVVYDPEGGFVTGGGWIASPAGAYRPDESLSGKATFGFVSKYKKGASVPQGNTEFQFRAGGLTFHSVAYDWLVVNQDGANAQFKGTGTVNGMLDGNSNAYKFMLWAGDGASDASPDTFRIRIWWEDADDGEHDVYDNGSDQAIGGGSIVVHTK